MWSTADHLELASQIPEHLPSALVLPTNFLHPVAHSRRSQWLNWLRALLRWPMVPWRDMGALLDRVDHLEAVLARHLNTLNRLQGALDHDGLTGAYSRLYFMASLRQEVARFARENRAPGSAKGFVVGLLDLDQFKRLNDCFGHSTGDEALVRVAEYAHRILRRDLDVFARYGGDEFVFLLPHTSIHSARSLANTLRAGLAGSKDTDASIAISVSIGLAACPVHGQTAEALLQAADRAMYRAKSDRNAVCIAEAP